MDIQIIITWLNYLFITLGIIVLVYGVIESTIIWVLSLLKREDPLTNTEGNVKTHLGSYILLSLEYFIAADIFRTVLNPTWEEIGTLAAIVSIRTVLSLFLNLEIKYFK